MNVNETGVCVIVAAFNAQDTVGRAVQSALAQDQVREVIVVDDASHDDTAHRARQQDDGSGRLAVVTMAENSGPAAARNAAIERSTSPLVCTLDADDYFLPTRMSQLLVAADFGAWDLIADDILIVPEDQKNSGFSVVNATPPAPCKTLDLESFVRGNISDPRRPRDELGFLKPIIKRRFLQQHGLRYDERLRLGEDYALYTRALIAGARFGLANACGYIAIERRNSISARHSAGDLEKIVAFDDECLANKPSLSRPERTAFAAHRMATQEKYDYRTVLDRKRDRGLFAALALLATRPASIPYIAGETIRAKARSVRGDKAPQPGFRFLIGMPGTSLSLSGDQ